MSKGKSGRIVIEVAPNLKKRLYSELALLDMNLKAWFIEQANTWIDKQATDKSKESKDGNNK